MTYRAGMYVEMGIADVHAYNLFLSFEDICCRLGLWNESVGWETISYGFHRLTSGMPKSKPVKQRGRGQLEEPARHAK